MTDEGKADSSVSMEADGIRSQSKHSRRSNIQCSSSESGATATVEDTAMVLRRQMMTGRLASAVDGCLQAINTVIMRRLTK